MLLQEIAMMETIAEFGVRVPEPLSEPFEFRVDGTPTFGYLVEQIYTSMAEPYKPQAHKSTWQGMGACLRALDRDQQRQAQETLQARAASPRAPLYKNIFVQENVLALYMKHTFVYKKIYPETQHETASEASS